MSDKVVMSKDSRIGANLEGKSSNTDHVYDNVLRTKSINPTFHLKGEKLLYVGEQLQDQEVKVLKICCSPIEIDSHGALKSLKDSHPK